WPYCVRAGNGTRDLYVGHKKTCDRVAAELTTAFRDGEFVGKGLYDALADEAQALREEVERGNRITVAMALDISAVGEALGIPGEEQEGGTGEFIDLIRELQKEVAALRARVVVVPERKLLNAGVPGLNRNSGWNACLDELARLNGLTVSESALETLRRSATGKVMHLNNGLCPDAFEGHEARDPDCPVCRALIETGKESNNV
ncbi:TPA: hypothetical protein L4B12_004396, partial [Pseudomonas aeruginosa]|nr:hypothetical protein [Pseudomonas aeruginosa]HBO0645838.1 hypothetical protein [Pseudomonas aeruginosa]